MAWKKSKDFEWREMVAGEDLSRISNLTGLAPEDDKGVIGRNPKNKLDQWYIPKAKKPRTRAKK